MADGQTPTSHEAELKQHSDERFAQFEEELSRQNAAEKTKKKILFAFITLGLIVWAWAAMR